MRLRYPLSLLCALLVLAAPARAQTYVEFFEIPGDPALHGLDFHDGSLWVMVRSSSEPRILEIDPEDGAVLSTTPLAVDFTATGVTWDGTDFWVSQGFSSSSQLYRVSEAGAVLGQIDAPSQLSNGLAYDDGALWVSKAYPDDEAAIIGVDPADGAEVGTVPFPSTQPGGIAFLDDGTLWATNVGDDSGSDIEVLWRIDRATGDVLDTLAVPTGAGRPRGLAYDGSQYLYAVMDEPGGFDDVIYKIDLSTEGTPVYSDNVDALDFGTVSTDEPETLTFTISNEGDGPLEISDGVIVIIPEETGIFTTDLMATTLAPGETLSVGVTFEATEYERSDAVLEFETNDVANNIVAISLNALGVFPEQQLGFAEAGHDFGAVRIEDPYDGGFAERLWPLRLINQGLGTLDVTDISIEGDDAFYVFDADALPLSIATADTAAVLIAFRPSAVGAYEAEVVVASNSAEPSVVVALSGTGIDPEIEGGDALWTLTVPDNPNTVSDNPKVTHLAPAGDLTGDGKDDLIVGTESYWVFAVNGNGWGTGDILWTFNTCPDNFNCGAISGGDGGFETSLATGTDIDGDGVPDVVVSTDGGNDHVYALSGADGSVIWKVGSDTDPYLAPYYSLSARFDVTGDDIPEVLTGTGTASANSPDPYNHRRVYLLDGATGDELWSTSPGLPSFVTHQLRRSDGTVLAAAGGGDESTRFVNGYAEDGQLVWSHTAQTTPFVMAPYERADGGEDLIYTGLTQSSNRLVRLDSDTGEVVWQRAGLAAGWAVAVPGDLNGNGTDDVVAGFSSGELLAFDGTDGASIWDAAGFTQVFGVDALRDVTGDGIPDVVSATGNGRALLHSGADGAVVWSYGIGNGTLDQAAEVVAVVPDLDGNGAPEVAVGARHGRIAMLAGASGIDTDAADDTAAPAAFALAPAFPNPFRATTTLRYTLPEAADVRLTVYDVMGRRVRTLVAQPQAAGTYAVEWDGRSAAGAPAAAGLYLGRIEAGAFAATRRMVLVR